MMLAQQIRRIWNALNLYKIALQLSNNEKCLIKIQLTN